MVEKSERHRSLGDVRLTAKAFVALREMLGERCPPREKFASAAPRERSEAILCDATLSSRLLRFARKDAE